MKITNHNAVRDPAGATLVGPWRLDDGRTRSFTGTRRSVQTSPDSRVSIDIGGEQHVNGRVRRYVWLGPIAATAAEARELARVLVSAASEFDDLSEQDCSAPGRHA
jgi:hypothetical protein